MNIVGWKWVFRNKYNSDGSIARHKARLVKKGYHHIEVFDFSERFSSIVKSQLYELLLLLLQPTKWSLHQMNVKNIFLHGLLQEEVYTFQPFRFIDKTFPTHVCFLYKKFVYGLKQTLRAWYDRFTYFFTLGFKMSGSHTSHISVCLIWERIYYILVALCGSYYYHWPWLRLY